MSSLYELEPIKMQNITINIPYQYDVLIQKLIKLNVTPNRSEAIRTAIREYLSKEFEDLKLFDEFEHAHIPSENQIN